MDTDLPYDSASFYGRDRDDIVKDLIGLLLSPNADQDRQRNILLEGPAKRGKTWLLQRIEETINQGHQSQAIACYIRLADFERPPFADVTLRSVACLWLRMHSCLPGLMLPPAWDPNDPADQQLQQISAFLGQYPLENVLRMLAEHAANANPVRYILLCADGMDEITPISLQAFEDRLLEPLFRYPHVRILAARRSEIVSHRWVRFALRYQTYGYRLKPFEAGREQVEKLLSNPALTYDELTRQMRTPYSWASPGANVFLVQTALQNHANGSGELLTRDDIRNCILILTRSFREAQPIDPSSFDRLNEMIRQFPHIDQVGAPRYQLNGVLGGISDRERDTFLGSLQDRGIGFFESNGTYRVHTEFVKLFREWQARGTP